MKMFKAVGDVIKHPRIRLRHGEREVCLSLAAQSSRNPGCLYVKVDSDYIGKISPAGIFHATGYTPDFLIQLLSTLAAEPLATVAEYGRLTGSCSFCGRTLTHPDSKRYGYGPVCAERYRLIARKSIQESTPSLWSEHSEVSLREDTN
jgi:hypothetical protein